MIGTFDIPNLTPDIISTFFLIVVFILCIIQKNKSIQMKLISLCCFTNIICMLSDIGSYIAINYLHTKVGVIFGFITNAVYYNTLIMTIFFALIYTYSRIVKDEKMIIRFGWITSIPIFILITCHIINAFHPDHFWYNYSKDGGYESGYGYIANFITVGIYLIVDVFLICKHWKNIDKFNKPALLSFPIATLIITAIQQYIFSAFPPGAVIYGTGITILIVFLYVFLQNRQSNTDDLTGVYTRQLFFDKISNIVNGRNEYSIVLISLNGFKEINSKYGNSVGDKLLVLFGSFLMQESNTVTTYKYGGDVFVSIYEGDNPRELNNFLNLVTKRLQEPWIINNDSDTIEILLLSCICVYNSNLVIDSRINLANFLDLYLKYVKKEFYGKVVICTKELIAFIERQKMILDAINSAIENETFEVYLQPIFDVKKNSFTTAEALVRLKDIKLDYISPGEFIPIANDKLITYQIDLQVFEKTCQIIKLLDEQNIPFDAISVNFSALIFQEDNFTQKIINILLNYGINPSKIRVELTESILIRSPEEVNNLMCSLKEVGLKFYLDDFGTGYSNLATVISLPFDYIKIDKSLIDNAATSDTKEKLLKSLISIFIENGFEIVCEGVETSKQKNIMIESGCNYIQGYYYSRPVPISDAISYFITKKM